MMRESPAPSDAFCAYERRHFPRLRPWSVIYLHLGDGRSIPILDVSERGLAADSAVLTDQSLQNIRFRIPISKTYIECKGKTVWSNESSVRKRSGILFVDLSEDARNEIRRWMSVAAVAGAATDLVSDLPDESGPRESSSEAPSRDTFDFDKFFPTESDPSFSQSRESFRSRKTADGSTISLDNFSPICPVNPAAEIDREDPEPVVPSEKIADHGTRTDPSVGCYTTGLLGTSSSSQTADTLGSCDPQVSEIAHGENVLSPSEVVRGRTPEGEAAAMPREMPDETGQREARATGSSSSNSRWFIPAPLLKRSQSNRRSPPASLAATVGFIAGLGLASLLIFGLLRFSKATNVAVNLLHSPATGEKSDAVAAMKKSSESGHVKSQPAAEPPAHSAVVLDDAVEPLGHEAEHSFGPNFQSARARKEIIANENAAPSEPRQQNQDPQRTPLALPAHDPAPPITSPPPDARPSPAPSSTVDTATSNPGTAAPPDSQGPKLAGSVASRSQFLGVQMPKDPDSEQLSGVLQIGQLVSSQSPAYPLQALQARVEGTVQLHATVGTDGSVKKIDPVSGPSPLIPAAMAAVQSWHYQPTMIAGKAVPNEQNITMVFRLSE